MSYNIEFLEDNFLVIRPVNKLTDAEYDILKPQVEKAGGHWREKVNGFVFKLDNSHNESYSEDKEKNQFFPTPYSVVKRMIKLSGLKDCSYDFMPKVLEPSAGDGAILDAIKRECNPSIYAIEPDDNNISALQRKGYWMVEQTTFEEWEKSHRKDKESFNYVIMNPPFSGSRDVIHTMMALEFVKTGGVLVAVVSENSLYYKNEHSEKFREWLKDNNAYIEDIPYGSFRESGTLVDTVIIKITKG